MTDPAARQDPMHSGRTPLKRGKIAVSGAELSRLHNLALLLRGEVVCCAVQCRHFRPVFCHTCQALELGGIVGIRQAV